MPVSSLTTVSTVGQQAVSRVTITGRHRAVLGRLLDLLHHGAQPSFDSVEDSVASFGLVLVAVKLGHGERGQHHGPSAQHDLTAQVDFQIAHRVRAVGQAGLHQGHEDSQREEVGHADRHLVTRVHREKEDDADEHGHQADGEEDVEGVEEPPPLEGQLVVHHPVGVVRQLHCESLRVHTDDVPLTITHSMNFVGDVLLRAVDVLLVLCPLRELDGTDLLVKGVVPQVHVALKDHGVTGEPAEATPGLQHDGQLHLHQLVLGQHRVLHGQDGPPDVLLIHHHSLHRVHARVPRQARVVPRDLHPHVQSQLLASHVQVGEAVYGHHQADVHRLAGVPGVGRQAWTVVIEQLVQKLLVYVAAVCFGVDRRVAGRCDDRLVGGLVTVIEPRAEFTHGDSKGRIEHHPEKKCTEHILKR